MCDLAIKVRSLDSHKAVYSPKINGSGVFTSPDSVNPLQLWHPARSQGHRFRALSFLSLRTQAFPSVESKYELHSFDQTSITNSLKCGVKCWLQQIIIDEFFYITDILKSLDRWNQVSFHSLLAFTRHSNITSKLIRDESDFLICRTLTGNIVHNRPSLEYHDIPRWRGIVSLSWSNQGQDKFDPPPCCTIFPRTAPGIN